MSALSPRDRRALWSGALLVAPVLAWRAIIAPLGASIDAANVRLESSRELFARELTLLRDSKRLPTALADARHRLDSASTSLSIAPDTVAATAALGVWLQRAARTAGLREFRSEPAPALPSTDALLAVQVDVRARGTTAAFAQWLAAVEDSQRAASIDGLTVSSDADGLLAIHARVRGLARVGHP